MTTVDQLQMCHSPMALMQPTISNGLPPLIPISVSTAASISEDYSRATDISTSSFLPLTPPSSIKSSPINTIAESSVASNQSYLVPCTLPNIPDVRSESRQYLPDQRHPPLQKMISDTAFRSFYPLRYVAHPQYCLMPSNAMSPGILPMGYSSMISSNVVNTTLEPMPTDTEKEWQKRDEEEGKSKVVQESLPSKSCVKKTSVIKDRKVKHSTPRDVRTKNQLRRLIHRNRLAVLKFMVHKRKQQKQKTISVPTSLDTKVEQATTQQVFSNHTRVEGKTEATVPDILAPSLKVTFDANQKIESICLFYHRRRKPDRSSDNRLSLLIEAMELVETFQGNPKLVAPPNK